MSSKQNDRHIIWSDIHLDFEDWRADLEEQYPDLPHVDTICVYPKFAKTVSETLEVEGVEVACVSGSLPAVSHSSK